MDVTLSVVRSKEQMWDDKHEEYNIKTELSNVENRALK